MENQGKDELRLNKAFKPLRAFVLYALTFLFIFLYESSRFKNWAQGLETEWINSVMTTLIEEVESFKEVIGLQSFIQKERAVWSYMTQWPEVIDLTLQPPDSELADKDKILPFLMQVACRSLESVLSLVMLEDKPEEPSQQVTFTKELKILIVGDSMIQEGFGPALERELLEYPQIKTARWGRYSTGLSRPDYFDWQSHLKNLLVKHEPDVVIAMFGANDAQDIRGDGPSSVHYGSDRWFEIYAQRVGQMMQTLERNHILTFWIGLPIMKSEKYREKMRSLNAIYEKESSKYGVIYIDTWEALKNNSGVYSDYLKDSSNRNILVRARDGIHVTRAGGKILALYVIHRINGFIELSNPTNLPGIIPMQVPVESPEHVYDITPSEKPQVQLVRHESIFRGKVAEYYAFLPPMKDSYQKFPVIFLLHGAWGSFRDWKAEAEDMLLSLAGTYNVVIITPDGDPFGWYLDSQIQECSQIESYFIRELIPHVNITQPSNGLLSICGLSMGGHGALVLSLRNPSIFVSASSMSGILDITLHEEQWKIRDVLGSFNEAHKTEWMAHSARCLVDSNPEIAKQIPIMFSCGISDKWAISDNRAFLNACEDHQIPVVYREVEGDHDWTFWKKELPIHIQWHIQHLFKP